jgi:DNA (cytosine-5)-methyltransferase 1
MKTVDLFAGCGGLSLGFKNAGFEIVAAYDCWQPAVDVYKLNFDDHEIFNHDLSDLESSVEEIRQFNPDIIIGGPPCQDFSHAGNRQEGARANLTETFAVIVSRIQPKWFVMENVDRAMKSEAYTTARGILKNAGYGLTEYVFDASLCGVPQARKRFICIGKKHAEDAFLLDAIQNSLSATPMTVRQYLGNALGIDYYYRHPRNYSRRGIFSIDEPSPTVRGVNRPVPKGYQGHNGDPVQISDAIRPLTTQERALLQTFPADFKWVGTKTDLEQIIGNAVPVKLAEFVANRILEYQAKHSDNWDSFRDWLNTGKNLSSASARDVVSRINRVNKIIVIGENDDLIDIAYKLEKTPEFSQLSGSVKSQLKRAVSFQIEFRENASR